MGKLVEKARARWKRWKPSLRRWLVRRQSSRSLDLRTPSSSMQQAERNFSTRVGLYLMEQLDVESNRVSYRTAIYTCREHVTTQLSAFNYRHDPRILILLANFAPVMRLLQAGTESALNILKPLDFNAKEIWHQHLQEERGEQMQIFTSLLADDELVRREMGNEEQQLEILMLVKDGLKNHSDVLTAAELDVISTAYDKVVLLSDTLVLELPEWFAVAQGNWDNSVVTSVDRGEEECIRTASLWSELNHPNVRKFFGACPVGEEPFLIHDDSEILLNSCPIIPMGSLWRYALDIARGLEYLHDRGIIHQSLSQEHLCTTGMRGVVSGRSLVRLTTGDSGTNGSSIQATSLSDERLVFRNILADLVEVCGSGQMPWSEASYSSQSSSQESYSSQSSSLESCSSQHGSEGALILPDATPSSSQLSMSDSSPSQNQSIREALAQPAPTRPSSVDEEIWSLLLEIYNEESKAGASWTHIIHKIDLLVQQERSRDSTSDHHPEEVIDSLEIFSYDGQFIKTMLDEAESFCTDLKELHAVNQPVLARLVNIYDQLHRCEAPLKRFVVEDFCTIIRRFNAQLDRRAYPSQVASVCASRTIAGRNYSIHHDIDRLLRDSSSLSDENPVHSWQFGWETVHQQSCDVVQALVKNPTSYLSGLDTDDEKREAKVLLQFEGLRCGTAWKSTAIPALSSIDESGEVPDWFIPPHEIECGRHLADGAFGAVYEGTWRGTEVVVKQILTDQRSAEARSQFRHEVDLWYSLNHDHLIKLYGACHVGRAAFVCERATQGTLVSFVKGKERYEIWKCIYEAALGLRHLHDRGIVHGDLKGNNILVCQENVKLADFGLSFSAKQGDTTVLGADGALGAYRWKAPECLMGCKPTFASDIYSFGMCIVEALTGELPWGNMMDGAVKYNVVDQKRFPTQPDHIDGYDWKLASRMCSFDPGERYTANTVVSYAYDQYQALEYWHDEEEEY